MLKFVRDEMSRFTRKPTGIDIQNLAVTGVIVIVIHTVTAI